MSFRIIAAAALILVVGQACTSKKFDQEYPSASCDTSNITYSGFVRNVMATSCVLSGCHDAASAQSGIVLDSHAGVVSSIAGGKLIGTITHDPQFVAMPQNQPKLDDCTITKIKMWVAAGAPNN